MRIEFIVEGDDAPRDWIFTFGYGHTDPRSGTSLAECYCVIHGTFREARREMVEMFGVKWAHQYESRDAAGVDRFGLRPIDTHTKALGGAHATSSSQHR